VEEKVTVVALNIHDAEAGALQAANMRKFKPTTLYFIFNFRHLDPVRTTILSMRRL
jgi:hypothetical protein